MSDRSPNESLTTTAESLKSQDRFVGEFLRLRMMSTDWIEKRILRQGREVSPGLDWQAPLLPLLPEVSYKIRLVMKSIDDFDVMEASNHIWKTKN